MMGWLRRWWPWRKEAAPANLRRGRLGEDAAACHLEANGWKIVARNYAVARGELDLVAWDGECMAFVEVKARRGEAFGQPVEAVHFRKRRELGRSARVWVDRQGSPELTYRLDVVGVLVAGQNVRIHHVENAFSLS
jgi:putative endonuclease